jgi:hypothetical protein
MVRLNAREPALLLPVGGPPAVGFFYNRKKKEIL